MPFRALAVETLVAVELDSLGEGGPPMIPPSTKHKVGLASVPVEVGEVESGSSAATFCVVRGDTALRSRK